MDSNQIKQLHDHIESVVLQRLKESNSTRSEWHMGKVAQVLSDSRLSVYVDGSTTPQTVPCNRKYSFDVGEEVFVHFINGDSRNKFVPYGRGL